MTSKVIYTPPTNLEEDKQVVISLTTEKDGYISNPVEVTLTAKAPAQPNMPVIDGPSEVKEGATASFPVTFNEQSTFDAEIKVSAGSIAFNALRTSAEYTAPSVDSDTEVTITVIAKRGTKKAEATKVIKVIAKGTSLTPELADNQVTEVSKGKELVVAFKNVTGTLKVSEVSDTITAVVDSNTVKVTGKTVGAGSFKVTQTETDKEESAALTVSITVNELVKTINYDANGGTGTMESIQVAVGSQWTVPECSFIAPSGKQFDKWQYTLSNGEKRTAVPGNKVDIGSEGTITVVAQWVDIPKQVKTVKFNANGGTGTMADVEAPLGEYTIPDSSFIAPESKEFKQWAESADGATNPHNIGDKVTFGKVGEFTLYAIWQDKATK